APPRRSWSCRGRSGRSGPARPLMRARQAQWASTGRRRRSSACAGQYAPSRRLRSLGVLDRACLTHDRDLDLAGIVHALLDLARHVTRELRGADLVQFFRLDDDAHLTSSLDGEGTLDAVEGVGDALQRLQALDVEVN